MNNDDRPSWCAIIAETAAYGALIALAVLCLLATEEYQEERDGWAGTYEELSEESKSDE